MGEMDKETDNGLVPVLVKAESIDITFKLGTGSAGSHSTFHQLHKVAIEGLGIPFIGTSALSSVIAEDTGSRGFLEGTSEDSEGVTLEDIK